MDISETATETNQNVGFMGDPDLRHSKVADACQIIPSEVETSKKDQTIVNSMDISETATKTNQNVGFMGDPDLRHSNVGDTCQIVPSEVETSKNDQTGVEESPIIPSEVETSKNDQTGVEECQIIPSEEETSKNDETTVEDESSDFEVEIMKHVDFDNNINKSSIKVEHNDTTESSSSFGDIYDTDEYNDTDAESEMNNIHEEILQLRKKKPLTQHWRSYIRSIEWRCQWAELQIKKLQSIARKCDKELEEYRRRKQALTESIISEDCGSKAFPYTRRNQGNEIMIRKRRRRVEDIEDPESYMSRHPLFSYYANKKSAANATRMDDPWGCKVIPNEKKPTENSGLDDEMLPVEIRGTDNYFEQLMRMIATIHIHVKDMKNHLDNLIVECSAPAALLRKLDSLIASKNTSASSSENPKPLRKIEETMIAAGQACILDDSYISGMLPNSKKDQALTGEEVSKRPYKIERNADDQPQDGSQNPNVKKDVVVYNRRPKQPKQLEKVINTRPVRKHKAPKFFDEIETTKNVAVPSSREGMQSSPKIRSVSSLSGSNTNKRKRSDSAKSGSGRLKKK